MPNRVQVYNAIGGLALTLPIGMDLAGPYFVTKIDGLGPVKAEIITTGYAASDGEVYQTSKTGKRNLVISLGYRANYSTGASIEKIRKELYAALPPKAVVKLRFFDEEDAPVEIKGYVESHEPDIFAQDPTVVISILCTLPYFNALSPVTLNSYNNSMLELNYPGSALTGFLFDLYVDRTISNVRLQNLVDKDIVYAGTLIAGDTLSISTVKGSKFIKRTRSGVATSVLNGLTSGALSMEIGPLTEFLGAAVPGVDDMSTRLTYTPKYVGI